MYGIMLVALIISGFIIGKIAHRFIKERPLNKFSKVITICQNISIFVLLFMMGFKIGSNKEVISGFSTIGLHSILFGLSALFGSSLITWLFITIANKIHLKKQKEKIQSHVAFSVEDGQPSQLHNIIMIGVFLGLVILGGIFGYFKLFTIDEVQLEHFVDGSLMALVFFIGTDMGLSQLTLEHLKSIGKSAVLICLGVVIGSVSGTVLVGFLLGYDLLFSFAVGSPMGWHSLAGIIFSKVSAELGAVAFTANLFRELAAMALVPFIGTFMSKESAVAACGATAMDTTLPAITKGLGKQYAVTGFACGIIISSIVPIFLPIIQSIYVIM